MGTEAFSIRMDVRVYELDPQRHVAGPVYLRYADHSRFVCMQTAGISVEELLAAGIGPVNLETTIRYRRELRTGDAVDVSCAWRWGRAGPTASSICSAAPTASWRPRSVI